jgi:hypothetical protein
MKKLRLEEIRVESFESGRAEDDRGTVDAHENLLNTGIIKCRTDFGPYCETQKQTNPCSIC